MLNEWLMENANPVIRYRTLTEIVNDGNETITSRIMDEIIQLPQTQKRLSCLASLDFSKVHGSNTSYLENVLPMLNDFGIHCGNKVFTKLLSDFDIHGYMQNLSYGEKLIAYPFFIKCGYRFDGMIGFVFDRVNMIYDFTRHMDYDMYDYVNTYKGVPKTFQDRPIIKPELVNGGMYRYPLIYDIVAFSEVYHMADKILQDKIDNIISYVISEKYDNIVFGYGIIPLPEKRYYSMGWDCKKPFNEGYASLHRLLLYSQFQIVTRDKWFQNTIDFLQQYKTQQGTYIFPSEYLIEKDSNWVLGSHMSLAENRRKQQYLEIETTFYMTMLLSRIV